MAKSIYVGNLPWSVGENELAEKFREHGNVIAARVVTDRESGRSRGFGFVEMDDADADKAIAAMNGAQWNGRAVVANEARPKTEQRGGGGDRQRNFSRY